MHGNGYRKASQIQHSNSRRQGDKSPKLSDLTTPYYSKLCISQIKSLQNYPNGTEDTQSLSYLLKRYYLILQCFTYRHLSKPRILEFIHAENSYSPPILHSYIPILILHLH